MWCASLLFCHEWQSPVSPKTGVSPQDPNPPQDPGLFFVRVLPVVRVSLVRLIPVGTGPDIDLKRHRQVAGR